MNIADQVAKNTRANLTNENTRGMNQVRIANSEHNGTSTTGAATIFLIDDPDMCFISEYKFKIIFNNGDDNAWENLPSPTPWLKGYMRWKTVDEFMGQYPLGSALDVDGRNGCQCVDYANAFWWGQTAHAISTGGNNAKGIWLNAKDYNAGDMFETGEDWGQIQKGDWVVWNTGTYGHIAMAIDSPIGDELRIWNENGATGAPWPAGGRILSEDTKSKDGFLGYFRYKYSEHVVG